MDTINSLLLSSKKNSNNSLCIADEFILSEIDRKKKIYNILERELNMYSEQFQVYFQPIYSLKDNKFTYMEALSRLRNTELGDIPPIEFVSIAENQGLIQKLGLVVFEKVCKFISENKDLVKAISVNFSVHQMSNPNIVPIVLTTINNFNISPSQIIIEITESIFIDNFEVVSKNMFDLAKAGVKFYLDDFGTGYSNLANVISLPFSTIKLDRSLVLMMEDSEKNIKLFSNLISTFKGAKLNIIVEGVETEMQNSLVKEAGADYIQGFLYSRPLPADECLNKLKNQ
jgi:EAL domain-containing protein (putative c-di-GMP-specific phosphodiesterase class I)